MAIGISYPPHPKTLQLSAMDVLIIGAGNLGNAFAVDLCSRGHNVSIWAHPNHLGNTASIASQGLEGKGAVTGHYRPMVYRNLGQAVANTKAIIVTIPSKAGAKEDIKEQLAQYSLDGKILIWVPGLLASLIGRQLTPAATFETSNSPYGCRIEDGKAYVKAFKNVIEIAAYRTEDKSDFVDQVGSLFPRKLEWRANILDVAMHNTNFITHPVTVIENASRIQRGERFNFYRDGMTSSVCEKMEQLDRIRMAIIARLGFDGLTHIALVNRWYGMDEPNYLSFARNSRSHNATLGVPNNMKHRYLTEDCRMLPFYKELATAFGIDTNIIDWVLTEAGELAGEDFEVTGLSLKKLGLDDLTADELVEKWGSN
ncbi:NAD/NADP octopine/nopaline dehydrogenase family protein [Agrobacterium vitis]